MGAWGTGPFDNDTAADWSADLENADDPAHLIAETLTLAADAEAGVDADVAHEAVAAAAALAGGLAAGLDVDPHHGPKDLSVPPTPELAALAVRALDRVAEPGSAWRELWDEAGEPEDALAVIDRLRTALAGAADQGSGSTR